MTHIQCINFPLNSIGKKIHTLPRCGLVTIQIVRHFLCSNNFWCGFVCQGVFFHTNAVLKSCTFYTGSIVALLDLKLIFKLKYLMNYSSDFNNFCRFQLLSSSLYYTTVVIRRPEFWGPNFYSLLFLSISTVS